MLLLCADLFSPNQVISLFGQLGFFRWLCQPYIPELMYHVTLWVPMLVLSVSEDLDELLQDGGMATVALLRKLGGVVIVAVDISFMLVVAVLGPKDRRAKRTCKMVDVVFSIKGGNIGASQCAAALVAEETETSKVISLTERILPFSILIIGWEKLGSHYLTTVLIITVSNRIVSLK